MRALGLDLGFKRIGVAVSDASGTIATPVAVLVRSGSRFEDHRRIAELVRAHEADVVVVGVPLSLSGRVGSAARAVVAEAEQLATVVGVRVETCDERLTTVTAERVLAEAGLRVPSRRRLVDKVAAAVMLQAWLDRQVTGGPSREGVS